VHIRLITSMDRCFAVGSAIQKHFKLPNGDTLPDTLTYKCKSFAMFQQQDGADICLFCMYVQEYNDLAPEPNRRTAYISYLDSVEYFRPRTNDSSLRTAVYHEIIISYLAWIRQRGFVKAHLWSCPPQRGNNFIFWCHPQHQRTPNKERLILWYQNMVHVARLRGVVTHVNNFYDEYFKPVLGDLVSHSSKKLTMIDLENKPEKKLTKKGKRMLNMAKIGRNGRGRGRNGWKGRATWGLESNAILAAGRANVSGLGVDDAAIGNSDIINQLKIDTIDEITQQFKEDDDDGDESVENNRSDECFLEFLEVSKEVPKSSADDVPTEEHPMSSSSESGNNVSSAAEGKSLCLCPPLFEGDYWIEESYRLYNLKHRKKVTLEDGNTNAFQIATSFVRSLRQHCLSLAFNQPVDPVLLKIPDYLEVIKQPMDFSTVAKKLRTHQYQRVSDMLGDIDLTLDNAMSYNPLKHPVHTAAANLKTYYLREWKVLSDRWKEKHLQQDTTTSTSNSDIVGNLDSESLQLKSVNNLSAVGAASEDIDPQDSICGLVGDEEESNDGVNKRKRNVSVEFSAATEHDDESEANPLRPSLMHSASVNSMTSNCSYENDGSDFTYASTMAHGDGLDEEEDSNTSEDSFACLDASSTSSAVGEVSSSSSSSSSSLMSCANGSEAKAMLKRLQEQHWLMRDVGKSVYKLRGDLLVLHLSPSAAPNDIARKLSKRAWDSYVGKDNRAVVDLLSSSTNQAQSMSDSSSSMFAGERRIQLSFNDNDPDPHHVSRPLMDGRHTMLEVSMFKHLQFDSLRRAKHATSLLLYYLHFPSHSLHASCGRCCCVLEGLRWHCSSCTDYDICGECTTTLNHSCPSNHPLTPYHVSSFE
jgi:hypothetical protein